jgi:tRNA1Val (adenine37-N6)-methyltransferase
VEIRREDLRIPESLCPSASFDAAVCNPPYRRLGSGRMNPDPEKTAARHEIAGTVSDFLAAAAYALREGGRLYTIYPAARSVELLFRMRLNRLEPKRLRLVHSRSDSAAQFVLAEGVKGGGEQLSVTRPLFIYERGGGYSAEMISIFQALSSFPPGGGDRPPRS